MQPLWCCTLLLFFSTSYGVENTILAPGVINPLSSSVVIALPTACQYSQQTATLYVKSTNDNKNATFTMPQCRQKRDLVIINDTQSGNVITSNLGYQVQGLLSNTAYTAYYVIGSDTLGALNFTTPNVLSAPPDVFARSGGMVVITVILSIAMLLLLVGLIAVLVMGGGMGKK